MSFIIMNKLLARQLKRIYGDNLPDSSQFQEFVRVVNETYIHNDNDRLLLERAISISSDDLSEANKKLRADAKNKRELLDKLLNAIIGFSQILQRESNPARTAAFLNRNRVSQWKSISLDY